MASEDDREEFWDRLEDTRTGMFGTEGRFVPMTHSLEPEDGCLWFLTAKQTPMAKAAAEGAETHYVVSSDKEGIYADIVGKLSVSSDREKLDEVWNFVAESFYDEGKDDPDLVLVKLVPHKAEVWLGPESGLGFLISLAKSKLTGDQPDMGKHFSLTFPAQPRQAL